MHILILLALLFALVVGPGLWVKSVMRRYREPANRYAKTGGQFARDLLDSLDLATVRTEERRRATTTIPRQRSFGSRKRTSKAARLRRSQ